jgi:hypothetical protein
MKVGQNGEDSLQRWCGFNVSVSTREGRQHDKVLPEDKTEAASSSYLMRRKHDTAWRLDNIGRSRGGTGEGKERRQHRWTDVNLTGLKIKKIHAVDSTSINGR